MKLKIKDLKTQELKVRPLLPIGITYRLFTSPIKWSKVDDLRKAILELDKKTYEA